MVNEGIVIEEAVLLIGTSTFLAIGSAVRITMKPTVGDRCFLSAESFPLLASTHDI
jgi:hypothetical protein